MRPRHRARRSVAGIGCQRGNNRQQGFLVPEALVPGVPDLQGRVVGAERRHGSPRPVATVPRRSERPAVRSEPAQLARAQHPSARPVRLVPALHRPPDHEVHGRVRQEKDFGPVCRSGDQLRGNRAVRFVGKRREN